MDNFKVEKKYAMKGDNVWETPYIYDVVFQFEKSVIGVIKNERIEGYSIEDGKKLFCIKNVIAYYRYSNYCAIQKENGKYYVFFDKTQKIHGPFDTQEYRNNSVIVSRDVNYDGCIKRLYGVYSTHGDMLLPVKYDEVILKDYGILVNRKGKYGMLSYRGYWIQNLNPEYYEISFLDGEKILRVCSDLTAKFGILSKEGYIIVPIEYDEIRVFCKSSVAIVRNGHRFGVYNLYGEQKLPTIFDGWDRTYETPFVKLNLDNNTVFYHTEKDKIFQRECVKFGKHTYKYFDGRWHRCKYKE